MLSNTFLGSYLNLCYVRIELIYLEKVFKIALDNFTINLIIKVRDPTNRKYIRMQN